MLSSMFIVHRWFLRARLFQTHAIQHVRNLSRDCLDHYEARFQTRVSEKETPAGVSSGFIQQLGWRLTTSSSFSELKVTKINKVWQRRCTMLHLLRYSFEACEELEMLLTGHGLPEDIMLWANAQAVLYLAKLCCSSGALWSRHGFFSPGPDISSELS